MQKYEITFYGKEYTEKPTGNEIKKINSNLNTMKMDYREIAERVGNKGCTFCTGVFKSVETNKQSGNRNWMRPGRPKIRRRKADYLHQQLIALDFDSGITFSEVKSRADKYDLSLLFAYKTFSWTPEKEKFRIVFALDRMVDDIFTTESILCLLGEIFNECDIACKECARMFYGGKGLLYLAEEPDELSLGRISVAYVAYMLEKSGEKHYQRDIKKFYNKANIKYGKKFPLIDENGRFVRYSNASESKPVKNTSYKKMILEDENDSNQKIEFDKLCKICRLYKNFVTGEEYYYYPELFHLATNMINIVKGKKMFLNVLYSEANDHCESYKQKPWKTTLDFIIEKEYKPQGCNRCPYCDECLHAKNMILTIKPGKSTLLPIERKEYVTIEEAEYDLKENFITALESDKNGIHIIKAQTGLGKTTLYLNCMRYSERPFLIVVPTHKLKNEVCQKALGLGIKNITCTPEMPIFSDELQGEIERWYSVGAGQIAIEKLRNILQTMKENDKDFMFLKRYIEQYDIAKNFEGHVITTHDRFILMRKNNPFLQGRTVIVDEDIMRTILSVQSVSTDDILNAIKGGIFKDEVEKKLKTIIKSEGYQSYRYDSSLKVDINDELLKGLENVNGNILDLVYSSYIFRDKKTVTYLTKRLLPCDKVIVLSATANVEIYRMLTKYDIHYYNCKQAEYTGRVELYPDKTYSRYTFKNDEQKENKEEKDLIQYIKEIVADDPVITFKDWEKAFDTNYHYGAVEGLNCLEGKNIAVVGLPNINPCVYKLYGMAAGVKDFTETMKDIRIDYNGYNFSMKTFENPEMRLIQLWLLESQIEQAVGRARLLRNDCTVKVFARFPVDQAVIV